MHQVSTNSSQTLKTSNPTHYVSHINSLMAGNIGSYVPTLRLLLLLQLLPRISQDIKLHLIH
jgi:hypothetical protein